MSDRKHPVYNDRSSTVHAEFFGKRWETLAYGRKGLLAILVRLTPEQLKTTSVEWSPCRHCRHEHMPAAEMLDLLSAYYAGGNDDHE